MSTGRILVVEDEAMIRSVVSELLRAKGYEVKDASNGEDAVELFDSACATEEPFHLLILDLTLPGELSGLQVLDCCRAQRPGVPIIIASGYADEDQIRNLCSEQGVELLPKPYNMADLLSLVARMLSPSPA